MLGWRTSTYLHRWCCHLCPSSSSPVPEGAVLPQMSVVSALKKKQEIRKLPDARRGFILRGLERPMVSVPTAPEVQEGKAEGSPQPSDSPCLALSGLRTALGGPAPEVGSPLACCLTLSRCWVWEGGCPGGVEWSGWGVLEGWWERFWGCPLCWGEVKGNAFRPVGRKAVGTRRIHPAEPTLINHPSG